jgi:CRISPR/Cas system-associated protein endoribonuclease Cas2
MKKLFILFFVLFLLSCTNQKLDVGMAENKVSELLELLKKGQYEEAQSLYSGVFQSSEPLEARIKRLQEIEDVAGKITGYEFLESSVKEFEGETILILKYKINCSKVNLTETFGVITEDGEYKIISQNITNKE